MPLNFTKSKAIAISVSVFLKPLPIAIDCAKAEGNSIKLVKNALTFFLRFINTKINKVNTIRNPPILSANVTTAVAIL